MADTDSKNSRKRILLINPPYERLKGFSVESIPLGLLYIATVLEKAGYTAMVYDSDTDFEGGGSAYTNKNRAENQNLYVQALKNGSHPAWIEIRKIVKEYAPDFVGVTMMTPVHSSCRKVLQIVKEECPKATVLAGGPHVTISGEKVMRDNPEIDFAFSGEAEEAILAFMTSLISASMDFSDINGLIYKKDGAVRFAGKAKRIDDLDSLPIPDRELLYNKEKYHKDKFSLMVASRGCPFSCAFCASVPLWEKKVRMRSPENILREIDYLVAKYNVKSFGFWDDTFTSNRRSILEFCKILEKKYKNRLKWDCLTNVNCVNEDVLKALKKSGCNRIRIGVESGSDDILKKIKKGITVEQVMRTGKMIKRFGFWLHAYFMVGLPHETEEDLRKTVGFIKRLNPDSLNLCTFTPYPGTELYDYVIEKGFMQAGHDYSIYDSVGHHSTDSFFMTDVSRERYRELLKEALEVSTKIGNRLTLRKAWLRAGMITPDRVERFFKRVLGVRHR